MIKRNIPDGDLSSVYKSHQHYILWDERESVCALCYGSRSLHQVPPYFFLKLNLSELHHVAGHGHIWSLTVAVAYVTRRLIENEWSLDALCMQVAVCVSIRYVFLIGSQRGGCCSLVRFSFHLNFTLQMSLVMGKY